jgi:hypothetical protein
MYVHGYVDIWNFIHSGSVLRGFTTHNRKSVKDNLVLLSIHKEGDPICSWKKSPKIYVYTELCQNEYITFSMGKYIVAPIFLATFVTDPNCPKYTIACPMGEKQSGHPVNKRSCMTSGWINRCVRVLLCQVNRGGLQCQGGFGRFVQIELCDHFPAAFLQKMLTPLSPAVGTS